MISAGIQTSSRHPLFHKTLGFLILIAVVSVIGCSSPKQEAAVSEESRVNQPIRQAAKSLEARQSRPIETPRIPGDTTEVHRDALPRVVNIELDPSLPVTGDRIAARATLAEADPSEVQVLYRWILNGEVAQESFVNVLDQDLTYGAHVEIEAVPYQNGRQGRPFRHVFTVANAPPLLSIESQGFDDDGVYQAVLRVLDPEQDRVHLELREAPEGMTLEPENKRLRWPVKAGTAGTYTIQLLGRDDSGNEALLSFQVKVSWVQDETGEPT